MRPGEKLIYEYSGFLQKAHVQFSCQEKSTAGFEIICSADIKLPILKKSFETKTFYEEELFRWSHHRPIAEASEEAPEIYKTSNMAEAGIIDPVTFFMLFHNHEMPVGAINLLVGKRVANLEVSKNSKGFEISRKDKDQKLFLIIDGSGVAAIEISVPVIGTLALKRTK